MHSESVGQIGSEHFAEDWFYMFQDWLRSRVETWPSGVRLVHQGQDHDLGTYYTVNVAWDSGETLDPRDFIGFAQDALSLFNGAVDFGTLNQELTFDEYLGHEEEH